MDWEGDPDPDRPRGRLGTVVLILAVVAAVGWFAQTPTTTPDGLRVDEAMATEGPTPAPARTEGSIEGLLGLSEVMIARAGTWAELVVPPDLAAPPTPRPTASGDILVGPASPAVPPPGYAWDGNELIVLDSGRVAAHEPISGAWRNLPRYPGDGDSIIGLEAVADGVLVTETAVGSSIGSLTTRVRWLLAPDDTWREVPTPPTAHLSSIAADGTGLVAVGADTTNSNVAGAASGVWRLPQGADTWEALPATPEPVVLAQVHPTAAGLLLLGFTSPEGPAAQGQTVPVEPIALLLATDATAWSLLLAPEGMMPGTSAVAVSTTGGPEATPDRVLVLGLRDADGVAVGSEDERADDAQVMVRTTYLLDAARSTVHTIELPLLDATATALAGSPFMLTSDGRDTVWAQSFGTEAVLLAMDMFGGAVDVVARPQGEGRLLNRQAVPFPGGLFLAGGFRPGSLADSGSVGMRIDRWTPSGAPRPTPEPTSREVGTGGNLGLADVLRSIAGAWQTLVPPAVPAPPTPRRRSRGTATESWWP